MIVPRAAAVLVAFAVVVACTEGDRPVDAYRGEGSSADAVDAPSDAGDADQGETDAEADVAPGGSDTDGDARDTTAVEDSAGSSDGTSDASATDDADAGRPDPHGHPVFAAPDLGDWEAPAPTLEPSDTPPGELADVAAVHFGAIPCGPHAQTVFDLLLPGDGSEAPYPLVVYFHGGGFTGGSRLGSFGGGAGATRGYVEGGLAYATVDYRFQDEHGIRTPLQDCQVCLQYIRLHADSLGVDPDRIVLAGASAGAGTSLWLGTSDDLADPDSPHPVLRQSTRVPAVLLDVTQAHYDILSWRDDVFAPEYAEIFDVGIELGLFDRSLRGVYGIPAGADTVRLLDEDADLLEFRAIVSFLDHMDASDAEIWAQTNDPDRILVSDLGTVLHHPFHVRAILRVAREVGVPAQANAPAIGETATEGRAAFARRAVGP